MTARQVVTLGPSCWHWQSTKKGLRLGLEPRAGAAEAKTMLLEDKEALEAALALRLGRIYGTALGQRLKNAGSWAEAWAGAGLG